MIKMYNFNYLYSITSQILSCQFLSLFLCEILFYNLFFILVYPEGCEFGYYKNTSRYNNIMSAFDFFNSCFAFKMIFTFVSFLCCIECILSKLFTHCFLYFSILINYNSSVHNNYVIRNM